MCDLLHIPLELEKPLLRSKLIIPRSNKRRLQHTIKMIRLPVSMKWNIGEGNTNVISWAFAQLDKAMLVSVACGLLDYKCKKKFVDWWYTSTIFANSPTPPCVFFFFIIAGSKAYLVHFFSSTVFFFTILIFNLCYIAVIIAPQCCVAAIAAAATVWQFCEKPNLSEFDLLWQQRMASLHVLSAVLCGQYSTLSWYRGCSTSAVTYKVLDHVRLLEFTQHTEQYQIFASLPCGLQSLHVQRSIWIILRCKSKMVIKRKECTIDSYQCINSSQDDISSEFYHQSFPNFEIKASLKDKCDSMQNRWGWVTLLRGQISRL